MLSDIRIASPCRAKWEQMAGDDRVRWCAACNLNVYNLAELTEAEARQLIARREGRLCVRLYLRQDGTILTRDCPVGVRAAMRRVSRVAAAVFSAVALPFAAFAQTLPSDDSKPPLVQIADHETGVALLVVDPDGAVVQNAKVTLMEETSKKEIKGKTDDMGRFLGNGLRAGNYRITIEHKYFVTYKGTISVAEHATSKLEVKMEPRPGVTVVVVGQI